MTLPGKRLAINMPRASIVLETRLIALLPLKLVLTMNIKVANIAAIIGAVIMAGRLSAVLTLAASRHEWARPSEK